MKKGVKRQIEKSVLVCYKTIFIMETPKRL